jgi:type II secretory pathway component PulF
MPVYAYRALDRQGKSSSGTIPADSKASAFDQLAARGLSPINVDEQGGGPARPAGAAAGRISRLFGSGGASAPVIPCASPRPGGPVSTQVARTPAAATKVSQAALESFTREMANLLAAGLPLSRGLSLLKRETAQPAAKRVWSQIHDDVVGGMPLADAMAHWPRVFTGVYVAMVRAGEAGGFLHVVLQQIADFRAREADLKGKVKAALIYPLLLACVACGVLAFLLTFFIPRFNQVFAEFGADLPLLTKIIVAASRLVTSYGLFVLAALVIGAVAARRAVATQNGKRLLERVLLKTPLVGMVIARFSLVRFSRMLGTLVGAGVPLVSALRTAREALGNQTLADTVAHAIDEVQRGAALSRSLAVSPLLFPPSVVEMVAVAEETGRLDKELVRLSISYEAELERRLRMLVALAEPLLLIVMASVIGTVVVGMILPVFMLQDLVK